mmetsp:Transcript_64081/g.111715  ORF Transcript_64081/g.111715 Transcript_64081/m.111715 type:complete len:733 (-) Transcript_64081:107-2305(-)
MLPITLCTAIFALLICCAAHSEHDSDQMLHVTCSNSAGDQTASGGALTQTRSRRQWQQLAPQQHTQQTDDSLKLPDKDLRPQSLTGSLPANKTALFETASLRTFTYSTLKYSTASVVSANGGSIFGASGSISGGFLGGVMGGFAASFFISHYSRATAGVIFGAAVGGFTGWALDNVLMPALNMSKYVDPENTTKGEVMFALPITDRMRRLAEEIEAVATYENNISSDFKNLSGHFEDAEAAHKALRHIKRIAKREQADGPEEPCEKGQSDSLSAVQTGGSAIPESKKRKRDEDRPALARDFEQLTEILGHSDTADFLSSAQVSLLNEASITDQDVASFDNGIRRSDVGPRNGTEHLEAMEGDMLYESSLFSKAPEQTQEKKVAAGRPWTSARVNYCFASDVPKRIKGIFEAAARQYRLAVTCLDFKNVGWKRGSSRSVMEDQECQESPAIFVTSNPDEGCYSWVGMIPNLRSQRLQLHDPGCFAIGIAMHEIGHALGMAHEHSRPDRDDHIRVLWENIRSDAKAEFEVVQSSGVMQDYDLFSIMHYDNHAFSADGSKVTTEALEQEANDVPLGQRNGLAMADVKQVAYMYARENSACSSNSMAGTGCLNTPNKDGPNDTDVCNSLTRCGPTEVQMCCACGGGVRVQCYKGSPCPQVAPLEVDPGNCLQDATKVYSFSHACIYRNTCNFNVSFKCPELECTHTVPARAARASYCGRAIQTGVCKGRCEVQRSS